MNPIKAMIDGQKRLALFREYGRCEEEVGRPNIWEPEDQAALDALELAIRKAQGERHLFEHVS